MDTSLYTSKLVFSDTSVFLVECTHAQLLLHYSTGVVEGCKNVNWHITYFLSS